ncbi:MAG: type II toxin-antitoxin system RelE/ParE family toxin [Planctomycetes bacterium]|nr:type II toxin-antitoxin system RelE/ParE family toxin [Planctomycetota bacterium]
MRVVFRGAALLDAEQAFDWLENEQPGLGTRFTDLLDVAVDRIRLWPESAPEVYPGVRCVLVATFRHRVFYRVEPDRAVILAVRHPSRDLPPPNEL